VFAFSASAQKPPVIVIPGISGSQLVNKATGKTAWFSVRRDKEDDLRLPMTGTNFRQLKDGLEATDIIRSVELPVLPDVEVYQSLLDALEARGYKEASWTDPKATDVYYVFPYDWRRDNVESAHLLLARMEAAKKVLKRPELKFDVIAHSMGGLIARYAAMYGMSDLTAGKPVPTWAGAAGFDKIMLFGTPNEGSFDTLDALLNGSPIVANRKLPLIDDIRAEDVMSSPAVYQLLPHQESARFLDASLKPMKVDLFSVETWIKYGWGPLADPKFLSKLKDAHRLAIRNKSIKPQALDKDSSHDDVLLSKLTYAQVKAFVTAALTRARRFQIALDARSTKNPVEVYAYGGNCQPTLDAAVLIYDGKKREWQTVLDDKEIKTAGGVLKKDQLKAVLFADGDGRVTKRSLLAGDDVKDRVVPYKASFFGCGTHTKLFLDKPIQDSFLSALVVEQQKQP
jgi:pimeloyl-ACP methyl ester carboxylesterase